MSNNYTSELFPFQENKFWEEDDGIHNGWNVLSEFFVSNDGKKLVSELQKRYENNETIFPAQKDIFRAFKLTSFEKVKVVILGQDPYPDERADGLCFSQKEKFGHRRDSLGVLFSKLKHYYSERGQEFNDENRTLDGWAEQGVLLLNTILTVSGSGTSVRDKAGSHKRIGWKKLTKRVIDSLLNSNKDVAFVLFGRHAVELFNSVVSSEFIKDERDGAYKYMHYALTNTNNQSRFYIVEYPHPVSHLFTEYSFPFDKFDLIKNINWRHH